MKSNADVYTLQLLTTFSSRQLLLQGTIYLNAGFSCYRSFLAVDVVGVVLLCSGLLALVWQPSETNSSVRATSPLVRATGPLQVDH
jgi:hypothetical protein